MTHRIIYLLHFEPRYKHAGHYLGSTEKNRLEDRVVEHLSGKGSPLVAAAVNAGCSILLVKTWRGGRIRERLLKNKKNTPSRLCPECCKV